MSLKPWFSTFLTNGFLTLFGLISGVLAARVLGPEDRGILAAVIYWPHFIAGIAAMGLNEGIVIHVARSMSSKRLKATIFTLSVVLAFVIGIVSVSFLPLLLNKEQSDYILFSQLYLMVFLPFTYLAQNFLAIDQGKQQFRSFNIQRIIQGAVYPLLLAIFWLKGGLTVKVAAIAVLSGTAIVALIRVWNARTGLFYLMSLKEAKDILSLSLPLHAVNLVMFVSQQADRMILVLFASSLDLGLYVVAFTAASAIGSIMVQTYINIMLPTAARFGTSHEKINEIIKPLRLLVGIIVISTALLLMVLPFLVVTIFWCRI